MAVRLSKEELMADFEELGERVSGPRKRADPTERGYFYILKHWEEFKDRIEEPTLVPTERWLNTCFKMIAVEQPGMIGPLLSLNSLTAYVTRFATAYKRKYKFEIPRDTVEAVKVYVIEVLGPLLGLSNKSRPKPMLVSQDLDALLTFLWVKDQHGYMREHFRVQLALYLLILAYTAARPGAVVVSDAYRHSNQCLTFRDLKFCLSKDEEGGPPNMSLTITFRYMKGDRDKDDEFLSITLWEDRLYPHLCPIMPFLALAFHYGAFDLTPQQLFRATMDRDIVEVNFNESILDTPLFRSRDGTTAWSYSGCYGALSALAFRAGYRCQVSNYAIRRGAANALDKSATWAEKGLILGHKNPKVLQARYIHKHTSIELQGIFHDRTTRTDRLHPLRGLAAEHFPGAPSSLRGRDVHQELRQHPEFLARRREWMDLKQSGASTSLTLAARRKMKGTLSRLRAQEVKRLRDEWIKAEGLRYLKTQPEDGQIQEAEDDGAILPPRRAAVVALLFEPTKLWRESLNLVCSLRTLLQGNTTNKVYPCQLSTRPSCKYKFKTEAGLLLHQARFHQEHQDRQEHPCPDLREDGRAVLPDSSLQHFCSYVNCLRHKKPYMTKASLTRHYKDIHSFPEIQYLCHHLDCPRHKEGFTTKAGFARHTLRCDEIHKNPEKQQLCPVLNCPRHKKAFPFLKELKRHINRAHKIMVISL